MRLQEWKGLLKTTSKSTSPEWSCIQSLYVRHTVMSCLKDEKKIKERYGHHCHCITSSSFWAKKLCLKSFQYESQISVCWADSTHFTVYSLSRRCNVAQRKKKKMLRLSMSLNPSVHWTQTTEHLPRFLRLSRYLFVLIC